MRKIVEAQLQTELEHYMTTLDDGPVFIMRDGRPIAALVPVTDDDEAERLALAYNPRFQQILEAADERIRSEGGLSHEELWATVEAAYDQEPPPTKTGRSRTRRAAQ